MQRLSYAVQKNTLLARISLSVLCALGAALYSPFAPLSLGSACLRAVPGLIAGLCLSHTALPHVTPRRLAYALPAALLGAASCAAGAELQVYGTFLLSFDRLLSALLCWLGLFVLFAFGLLTLLSFGGSWLRRLQASRFEAALAKSRLFAKAHPARLFLLSLGVLLLCWLPVWLAYFPGLANYDIRSHMAQCVSNQYSTLHPMCYTLLLKGCLLLADALGGGTPLAIALLCLFQMLLLSAALSYALSALRRMGAPAYACLLALAFFALFPVFPLLAISTTKDIPYAAFCLLLAVMLLRFFTDPDRLVRSPKAWASFLLFGVLMGILRYNGLFSLVLWLVAFLLLGGLRFSKKHPGAMPRILLLFTLTVGLALGSNAVLNLLTKAAPSFVTTRDLASLPSQQLVRVALTLEKGSEDYREITHWYSGKRMLEIYRPRLADYTKRHINVDHDNGWRGFAETWLRVGLRHPKIYAEAFLELNRGLWFVHDTSHANIYPHTLSSFGYLLNNQVDCRDYGDPIVFHSFLPGLQAFLNRLTTENTYLSIPGLRLIFSIGFQCWLSVLLFLSACYRRQCGLACAMGWILCLAALLAAAPAVLVRYTLPVFLGNGVGLALMAKASPASKPSDAPSA